jgi:hypothetical protein
VIAAVEGFALGGGCELALCCDLIIASASAVFALPEVGLGLIPGGGGTQLLPRRIGLNSAADLVFTGRKVAADEALRMGLVDRLVPERGARSCAYELADEIAVKSPISLRAAKRALRKGLDVDLASGLEIESRSWEEAAFSADRVEGIEAFNLRQVRIGQLAGSVHDRTSPPFPARRLPVDERESALPLPAQLTRFIITGGFSAIVDFGLLVILMALGLGHTAAKAISFIAGTTTAYLINRRWTFRAAPSTRRFIAVVVLYAVTFACKSVCSACSPAHCSA